MRRGHLPTPQRASLPHWPLAARLRGCAGRRVDARADWPYSARCRDKKLSIIDAAAGRAPGSRRRWRFMAIRRKRDTAMPSRT